MSYTNASVQWRACIGTSEYGDIARASAVTIAARKQPHQQVIRTENGKELLTKHIYYVDPSIEPHALEINKLDMLDNEIIIETYRMCTLANNVRMIRFITI